MPPSARILPPQGSLSTPTSRTGPRVSPAISCGDEREPRRRYLENKGSGQDLPVTPDLPPGERSPTKPPHPSPGAPQTLLHAPLRCHEAKPCAPAIPPVVPLPFALAKPQGVPRLTVPAPPRGVPLPPPGIGPFPMRSYAKKRKAGREFAGSRAFVPPSFRRPLRGSCPRVGVEGTTPAARRQGCGVQEGYATAGKPHGTWMAIGPQGKPAASRDGCASRVESRGGRGPSFRTPSVVRSAEAALG
jgi:hypothetical protein